MVLRTKKVLFLLSLFIWLACDTQKENIPDKAGMLANKGWIRTGITVEPAMDWNGNGEALHDVFIQMPECSRDDIEIYLIDSSFKFTEGYTKCNPVDPQIYQTGTWNIQQEKLILNTSGKHRIKKNILKITEKELILSYEVKVKEKIYLSTDSYSIKVRF